MMPLILGQSDCKVHMVYVFRFKVTMNKLCARLFIIIFIDLYRKSEYIPTVTNFASILANCFYFLRKIRALRPSVLMPAVLKRDSEGTDVLGRQRYFLVSLLSKG